MVNLSVNMTQKDYDTIQLAINAYHKALSQSKLSKDEKMALRTMIEYYDKSRGE